MAVYSASAIAVVPLENSKAEILGNYIFADVNTPVYDAVIFHDGAYSFKHTGLANTNYINMAGQITTDLNSYAKLSMSAWVRHNTGQTFNYYLSKHTASGQAGFFLLLTASDGTNKLTLHWNGTGYVIDAFDKDTEQDTWINLGVEWDGTPGGNGTVRVYKNNVLVFTQGSVPSGFGSNNTPFYLGGSFITLNQSSNVDSVYITDDNPSDDAGYPIVEITGFKSGSWKNQFSRSRQRKGAFS